MKGMTYEDFFEQAKSIQVPNGDDISEIEDKPIHKNEQVSASILLDKVKDLFIMGIDPGKTGAIAVISMDGMEVHFLKFSKSTLNDIKFFIREWQGLTYFAFIEKVQAMKKIGKDGTFVKQGVVSAFTFGENYGQLQGLLTMADIKFERILPMRWQSRMKCLSGGDKKVTKSRAQELMPSVNFTEGTADAYLIGECGRRMLLNIGF